MEKPNFNKFQTKGDVDPNRAEELAAARKRRLQKSQAAGRSKFRIDLTGIGIGSDQKGAGRVSLG